MKMSLLKTGIAALALCPLYPILALAGTASAPNLAHAVDGGSLQALGRGGETMSITLPLSLRDPAAAETMMVKVATPGDPLFHQFLTPAQIRAEFGPDEAAVTQATSILTLSGLSVTRATATTLKVTGSVATLERVFQTELHEFSVPGEGQVPGVSFQAAIGKPVVPPSINATVQGTLGFSTAPAFTPKNVQAKAGPAVTVTGPFGTVSTGTAFGVLTVTDFAKLYDVEPLYAQGISGAGRTLAVVTLDAFTPSSATAYWQSLGLDTKPNRITVVDVDGGPGAPNNGDGSIETTIDVEQSGGIAPMADIIVYQAPGTDQGFVDAFATAVEDNVADSISTSFGNWEILGSAAADSQVTDPLSGETVTFVQAMHRIFVLGALEGQSLFAAAGDSGAFDTVDAFGTEPNFTTPLSVDFPASDTAMVAAGGTTLPGTQTFLLSTGSTVSITNPQERVWAEDYLGPLCTATGFPDVANCDVFFGGLFPVGGGGGISVLFEVPVFQIGLPGVLLSQPGQSLIDETTSPPTDEIDLPANFAGRNVPDFVYNADPLTGYEVLFTETTGAQKMLDNFGGTSFVAPQLNGVTALLGQNAGQRFGLLTVPLYALARTGLATVGPRPIFHTINAGDNWFFAARNGYSPAAGLGTIQVSNLAAVLK
jgi:subtilase family serine protease